MKTGSALINLIDARFPLASMANPTNSALNEVLKEIFEGQQQAVTVTTDGLTTGLIGADTDVVLITSDDANKIATLPLIPDSTWVGNKIIKIKVGSTGCELRTPALSNQTINNVDSDSSEAALAANNFYLAICTLATGWILTGYTNLGAVQTAIIPD